MDKPPIEDELGHAELAGAVALRDRLATEIRRVYIGPDAITELLLATVLAGGHALLEGVPGLAKTTLVKAFARALGCEFKRIQFTPDLLPADITGTFVFNARTQAFELRHGPVFAQVVLGDEINRAPAKTQSALLEAMQERQATIDGSTHPLPTPFVVLATQNPVEQEGVYLLPEAQVDRFLIKLQLEYPSAVEEQRMLQTYNRPVPSVAKVTAPEELLDHVALGHRVHIEERLMDYIVRLVTATRKHPRVALGASPRGSLALLHLAKSWALIHGRGFVLPDDLRMLAPYVLRHRILLTPDASIEGLTSAQVLDDVLARTRYGEAN